MKKHTAEQIIRKLREAEVLASQGKDTAAICQALEISSQTYHRWRARYGRLDGDEAKRLRELEEENQRLKRLVAEQALDLQILKEVNKGKW
jgi:putative transposase